MEHITAVEAELNYLTPMTAKPVNYTFQPPPEVPWRSGKPEPHRVPIRNARALPQHPSLDEQGFVLVHRATSVRDFYDDAEVRAIYYPEVEALLRRRSSSFRWPTW